jgi:ubiquinone/menaquinone biosynthesis C-methylase UbiE
MNRSVTRINYTRLSRWYDWFSFPELKIKEIGCKLLDLRNGEKVLEIGFGTGQSLISLAWSVGEGGKVVGIDLSDGMAQVARSRISHAKLSYKIGLIMGDAVHIPFKDNFLDAIYISFTLELFKPEEILLVLKECKRVLRTKGRIGLVALENKNCTPIKINNWFHARIPSIVDCVPIDVRDIIERSGFELVELIEKVIAGLPVVILTARNDG